MQIKINNETQIDIGRLIQSRMAILANSGGGKSWAVRRLVEQAADKVQVIILDPEGEFASLRERHDFVLCGKDQDVPVEVRSAAKLAEMLLEAKASAVIDLYELSLQDRKKFVRIFCETMVAVPKKLYHPCLVILDEAHDYVPEGKPSEATAAVEALASKGRKREFALILASQRISKVSKDALSECNNVMIGRATWAIDRKRAAEELGLTDKEEILSLKKMKPGEFYITGPAVSDDLLRITVGDVKTTHGNSTYSESKPVPPSASLKKALAMLKNLPQEAEREARTIDELKSQIRELKSHKCPKVPVSAADTDHAVRSALAVRDQEWTKRQSEWKKRNDDLVKAITKIATIVTGIELNLISSEPKPMQKPNVTKYVATVPIIKQHVVEPSGEANKDFVLGRSHQKVIDAIAWINKLGVESPAKEAVALVAKYRPTSGGFANILGSLRSAGYITYPSPNLVALTDSGSSAANHPDFGSPDEMREKILSSLEGPERKVLEPIIAAYPDELTHEELAERTGYQPTSGGFANLKGRLRTFGLITYPRPNHVRAADILFP